MPHALEFCLCKIGKQQLTQQGQRASVDTAQSQVKTDKPILDGYKVFHLSCFPRRFLVLLQLMRRTHTTSLTAGGGEAGDTVLAGLCPGPHWPLHWHLGVFCQRRALGLLERSLPVNMERWKGLGIQTPLGGHSTKLPSP